MDKQKLLEWMEQIEHLCLVHNPQDVEAAAGRAMRLRCAFAADANCASIKDPTDTPPPSSWPSVSRIRKETRAEVVAEIADYLETDAAKLRSTIEERDKIFAVAFEAAARVIRGKFA